MRGKARTWGTPTTCTVVYRNKQWFASITVNCEPVRETGNGAIGIDFGVLTAAALSDGTKIKSPKFLSKATVSIRQASIAKRRKRSPNFKKKIKASKRWRKASKKVSRLQRKIANQRQYWVHQVAADIVSCNSLVATEKLNLKGMTASSKKGTKKRQKTGLNRSILDIGMGMLRSAIKYKLVEAGGVFIEIPTKKVKPSQTCPECGHQQPKTLAQREHHCAKCGYSDDRDVAAAKVMLSWALGTSVLNRGEESSTVNPTPKNCGGFRQLSSMKRQKPLPQP